MISRILISFLGIAMLGCGGDDSNPSGDCDAPSGPRITLRIGALEPGSGASANDMWIKAIQMAVEEMNAALACNPDSKNIQFELVEHDDGNDVSIVTELVDNMLGQGILTLFTDTSGVSGAANGLNYDEDNPRGIPIVCSPCTDSSFNTENVSPPSRPTGTDLSEDAWMNGFHDPDNWLRRTSITGDLDMGLAQRILYSRGDNGDLNDDGVVKLVFYANQDDERAYCDGNLLLRHLDEPSRFRCERIAGPPNEVNLNTWDTFDEEAAMLVDTVNSTPIGTAFPSELASNTDFLEIDVAGTMMSEFFTIDEVAGTMVTARELPNDGEPDFVMNYLSPATSGGGMNALNRLEPAENYPYLTVQAKNSFVRASTLFLMGNQAEGIEGIANLLYSRDASGRTFAENFENKNMAQVAGFDASVYDAIVLAMLGVLKAALPLEDPSSVTRTAVRDALDDINDKSGTEIGTGEAAFDRAVSLLAAGNAVDYAGASGPVDFDAEGNVIENMEFYKVADGRWTTRYIFDCVSDPAECPTIDCEADPAACE